MKEATAGYSGTPLVTLDGTNNTGGFALGFRLDADNNTMTVLRAGNAVSVSTNDNNCRSWKSPSVLACLPTPVTVPRPFLLSTI